MIRQSPSTLAAALVHRGGVALLLLLACTRCAAPKAQAPSVADSTTRIGASDFVVAERGALADGPRLSGSLAALQQSTLRAEVAGPVARLLVRVGDRVRAGQLLAVIQLPGAGAAVRAAEAAVRSTALRLRVAEEDAARTTALLQVGGASRSDADLAALTVADARAAQAEADARLAAATADTARLRITAPFAGVVSERFVTEGTPVQPGDALLQLVDPSSLVLEASVPSGDIGAVQLGQRVRLTATGYPGRLFDGRVDRIAPALDAGTRQLRVTVRLTPTPETLAAGAFAEGHLTSRRREVVLVPRLAIDEATGHPVLARLRGGRVRRTPIALGSIDAGTDLVEVTRGIAPGDTVLVGAARQLTDGTRLIVAEP